MNHSMDLHDIKTMAGCVCIAYRFQCFGQLGRLGQIKFTLKSLPCLQC